jgi:hypothetical protein
LHHTDQVNRQRRIQDERFAVDASGHGLVDFKLEIEFEDEDRPGLTLRCWYVAQSSAALTGLPWPVGTARKPLSPPSALVITTLIAIALFRGDRGTTPFDWLEPDRNIPQIV